MALLTTILISIAIFIAWNLILLVIKKKFPKFAVAMQIISIVFIVIAGVFIVLLYLDARDFMANYQAGDKTFILEKDLIVKSAIILKNNTPVILYQSDIDRYTESLKQKDYASLRGDSYKLLILKMSSLENLPDFNVKYGPLSFDKAQSIRILTDDSYAESLKQGQQTDQMYNFNSIYELRALILSEILSKSYFSQDGQTLTVMEFKKGNIVIYPETLIFKVLKLVPASWMPQQGSQSIQ